jgi:hypothetical protein
VFTTSSPTAWGNGTFFAKWIPRMLNNDQKVMGVLFANHPSAALDK